MPNDKKVPAILVVDDNEAKRYSIARALRRGGYDVAEAATGRDAVRQAAEILPDMMVVDVKLPDLNGFEVCRIIKNNAGTASIPVLHTSATINTSEARIYGLEEGADAFLTQEAKPEEILATVRARLRQRETEILLRRQNAWLQIISLAAERLLSNNAPETMVNDLFVRVCEHLHVDLYFNYMVDEDEKALYLDSSAGMADEVTKQFHRIEFGQGVCGTVAQRRKAVVAENIMESSDEFLAGARALGFRSYVCNPLIVDNRLLGTLAFGSRTRDSFEPDELEFLRTICHYVALAKEKILMLKEAQNKTQALEKANRRKDEFMANMSHEIRTPMNAVIGLSTILAKSQPLSDKQREYISVMQLSANSLLSLINDLLDIAKLESHAVQLEHIPFNLQELMRDILDMMSVRAREKNIALEMHSDIEPAAAFCGDPTRIKQILVNLLSNALKFTEHGKVSLSVAPSGRQANKIMFRVTDSGIGIAPEKLETIFAKFSQADNSIARKYGGTGLGLAITKTLTDLMDGSIEVMSKVGEGSSFTVILTLKPDMPEDNLASAENVLENAPAPDDDAIARESPLILLAEDYKPNVVVACTLLEQMGCRYQVARNGEEAMRKMQEHKFDLVLMDVQMPVLDGYAATRLIRAGEANGNGQRMPIIGITAYALVGDKEKCLASGMDDYLSKPFQPKELADKIAAFVRQSAKG